MRGAPRPSQLLTHAPTFLPPPPPFSLRYGWWNSYDEPSTGRWPDGENSNYGIWNLAGDPYSILTAAMTELHSAAEEMHAAGPL